MDLIKEVERYEMKCVALREVRWDISSTTKMLKKQLLVESVNNIIN